MQEKSFETIKWTFDSETGIGRIVLNRPDSMNALSTQLRRDIINGFEELRAVDDEVDGVAVRAVIISGAGDQAFCAGADINEFEAVQPEIIELQQLYLTIEEFDAPVIASIDGYCLGGGLELALACDFRYASEDSELGQTEVNIGLIPGGGGTQRLVPLVGPSRTKQLCMTGEQLSGVQAAEEGIVDRACPSEELEDEVEEFAKKLAEKAPLAIRAVKSAVNNGLNVGLHEGWIYERRMFHKLRQSEDHTEGRKAFTEKRDPEWKGR